MWDLYETGEYKAIEGRSLMEIADTIAIYKTMFENKKRIDRDLERLKKIDKERAAAAEASDG